MIAVDQGCTVPKASGVKITRKRTPLSITTLMPSQKVDLRDGFVKSSQARRANPEE